MQTITMSKSESKRGIGVIFISCASKKADTDCDYDTAKSLNLRLLFIKSPEYSNKISGVPFHHSFILFAKYHFFSLDQYVVKYDMTLNKMSATQKRVWADKVQTLLRFHFYEMKS